MIEIHPGYAVYDYEPSDDYGITFSLPLEVEWQINEWPENGEPFELENIHVNEYPRPMVDGIWTALTSQIAKDLRYFVASEVADWLNDGNWDNFDPPPRWKPYNHEYDLTPRG